MIDTYLNHPPSAERPVVASDMEGTLSTGVTWKGMRDYLMAHGQKAAFDRFLRPRYPKIILYRLGLINGQQFKEQWMVDLLALFAGYDTDQFAHFCDWVVEQVLWPNRRQPVIDELQNHLAQGRRVVLVSGLIEPMLGRIAAKIGCEAIGTPLHFQDGVFSGQTAHGFTTGEEKVVQLKPFLDQRGRILAAYGDTAADIPMLSLSTQPTAVAPDKRLAQHAAAHNWRII